MFRPIILYLVTCRVTGRQYVGVTRSGVRHRWVNHCSDARRGAETAMARAIRKHGEDAFSIEHVASCRTPEDASATERALIRQHGTFAPAGYNLTLGGDGVLGVKWTPERKEHMRQYFEGRPFPKEAQQRSLEVNRTRIRTEEEKRNIAEALRARWANMSDEDRAVQTGRLRAAQEAGKKARISPQDRVRLVAARKAAGWFKEETRRKIGQTQRGRKQSEETKGRRLWTFRRKHVVRANDMMLGLMGIGC